MSMERNFTESRNPVLDHGNQDGASSGRELEPVSKRQRHMNERPSLYDLCMRKAVFCLPEIALELQSLPDDLAIPLMRDFLRRVPAPSVKELRDFCDQVYWVRQTLCRCGISHYLCRTILPFVLLPNIVRLDLGGCPWLDNLEFLCALDSLECLNLRGCWRLGTRQINYIKELRQLQCLDVENIPNVTDDLFFAISGLSCLWALNVSGTYVSDRFVEALTYGSRLHTWTSQHNVVHHQAQYLLSQHPVFKLTYFRLCGTQITDATTAYLQAIPYLLLLDVRHCVKMTGMALSSLRAKHRLIPLLNNNRLAARTNAMLAGVLRENCGCSAMSRQDEVTDEVTELCQQAFSQLLHKSDHEWYELDFSVFASK